jgi:acyl-CoA synthetase (AMP-forming)/AMP-acid ligase II
LDLDELLLHCQKSLAKFKCPKDLVVLPALPRNPSGKVLKRVLRDQDRQHQSEVASHQLQDRLKV